MAYKQGEMTSCRIYTGSSLRHSSTSVGGIIQADGVHTPYRQYQKAGGSPTCPHCPAEACDWEHILWRCPRHRNAAGTLSGPLRRGWNEARGSPRCLWTLGHVPAGWAPDPSSTQMKCTHDLHGGVYDPNGPRVQGGTDGGAVKTAVGPRAGIGVALSNGIRVGIPLPGKRQTAQWAEVAGLALALEYTTGPLTLAVDNEYVCNMAMRVKQGEDPDPRCRHADYWRYIARNIHKLEEIRWIKSH